MSSNSKRNSRCSNSNTQLNDVHAETEFVTKTPGNLNNVFCKISQGSCLIYTSFFFSIFHNKHNYIGLFERFNILYFIEKKNTVNTKNVICRSASRCAVSLYLMERLASTGMYYWFATIFIEITQTGRLYPWSCSRSLQV